MTAVEENERVKKHLPLVRHVLNQHRGLCRPGGMSREDAEAEGLIGLLEAIRTYDPEQGPFGAWAGKLVLQEMLTAARRPRYRPLRQLPEVDVDGELRQFEPEDYRSKPVEERLAIPDLIAHLLEALEPRRRKVVELLYGLVEEGPLTLEQAGRRLGLSRERVRQLHLAAMERMRSSFDDA